VDLAGPPLVGQRERLLVAGREAPADLLVVRLHSVPLRGPGIHVDDATQVPGPDGEKATHRSGSATTTTLSR
jgi:hypothetical protein